MPAAALKKYSGQYWPSSRDWSRWSPLLARLACVVLAIFSLWQIVRLILLWLSGPEVALSLPPVQQSRTLQSSAQVDIARWHLFGRSAASNPLNLAALPETPLDLELRGIVSGMQSEQDGYAIIVARDGGQWVYAVGDSVPGGATVRAITPEQVVLRRNGQDETLSLPELLNRQSNPAGTSSADNSGNGFALNAAPPQLRGLRGQQAAPRAMSVPGGLAGVQLDNANLQRLAQSVQVTPVSGGFKVFPGRNATLFRQLGLQANDVITAVNGRPIANMQAAMQLFQNLDSTQAITLSVKRGNQVVQLQPDLAAVNGQ